MYMDDNPQLPRNSLYIYIYICISVLFSFRCITHTHTHHITLKLTSTKPPPPSPPPKQQEEEQEQEKKHQVKGNQLTVPQRSRGVGKASAAPPPQSTQLPLLPFQGRRGRRRSGGQSPKGRKRKYTFQTRQGNRDDLFRASGRCSSEYPLAVHRRSSEPAMRKSGSRFCFHTCNFHRAGGELSTMTMKCTHPRLVSSSNCVAFISFVSASATI